MSQLWTPALEARASSIWDFQELGVLGKEFLHITLDAFHVPRVGLVSGPISTGGKGNIEKNLKVFAETVRILEKRRIPLFNQMPFESHMIRIAAREGKRFDPKRLMEGFYLPLFVSGRIGIVIFIFGWESSSGATQEHTWASDLKIPRFHLSEGFEAPPVVSVAL